jgi:hypothetical protein
MKRTRTVLHFGYDTLLTEARVRVLEDAGYRVLDADSVAVAQRSCRTHAVDLLIICHWCRLRMPRWSSAMRDEVACARRCWWSMLEA